jgi:hypothetical protein
LVQFIFLGEASLAFVFSVRKPVQEELLPGRYGYGFSPAKGREHEDSILREKESLTESIS